MRFGIYTKDHCKECGSVTHIQKGLNSKDYKSIIRAMVFIMALMTIEIVHLYFHK